MRATDTFLISYSGSIFSTITILSLLKVASVEVYAALFAIEFFILSELVSPTGPVTSRKRTIVGILLVAVFGVIMFGRIIEVVMQAQP